MNNFFSPPTKSNTITAFLFLVFLGITPVGAFSQNFCVLACNDQITIAVPPNGSTEFLPDYMLEGDYQMFCPNAIFQAQVQINNSWLPATGNFVFEPVHIGNNYIARIRDLNTGNSCWGNVTVVEGQPVRVKEALGSGQTGALELAPNPASQHITLRAAEGTGTLNVRIFDLQGKQILEQTIVNGSALNLSSLRSAPYSVTATTAAGKVFTGKFSKTE